MVSSTILNTIDLKRYRQDGQVEWSAGFRHQSLRWCGLESYYCDFLDIPKVSIVSFIWTSAHGVIYHYPIINAIDLKTYIQDGRLV